MRKVAPYLSKAVAVLLSLTILLATLPPITLHAATKLENFSDGSKISTTGYDNISINAYYNSILINSPITHRPNSGSNSSGCIVIEPTTYQDEYINYVDIQIVGVPRFELDSIWLSDMELAEYCNYSLEGLRGGSVIYSQSITNDASGKRIDNTILSPAWYNIDPLRIIIHNPGNNLGGLYGLLIDELVYTPLDPPNASASYISCTNTTTGSNDTMIPGDYIFVTWDNTAGGNNLSNISSVVMDFIMFGPDGLTSNSGVVTNSQNMWSASYTLLPGDVDASAAQVLVKVTDGNGLTTEIYSLFFSKVDIIVPVMTTLNTLNVIGNNPTTISSNNLVAHDPGDPATDLLIP